MSGPPEADEVYGAAIAALMAKPARYEEAMQLLRRGAALGHAGSQETLGSWMLEGLRTPSGSVILRRSPRQGVELLKLAAAAGNEVAQHQLGFCYAAGLGVRRDVQLALHWYRKAARKGIDIAAMNIASLYRAMGNHAAERRWLHQAAKMGLEEAQLALAQASLIRGRSEQERKEAIRVLKRIAGAELDPESGEAMLALVEAYRKGTGVRRSKAMAQKWLRKASASGHAEAAEALADLEASAPAPSH